MAAVRGQVRLDWKVMPAGGIDNCRLEGCSESLSKSCNLFKTVAFSVPALMLQAGVNKLLLMGQEGGAARMTMINLGELLNLGDHAYGGL